jgi:hypothetical protein
MSLFVRQDGRVSKSSPPTHDRSHSFVRVGVHPHSPPSVMRGRGDASTLVFHHSLKSTTSPCCHPSCPPSRALCNLSEGVNSLRCGLPLPRRGDSPSRASMHGCPPPRSPPALLTPSSHLFGSAKGLAPSTCARMQLRLRLRGSCTDACARGTLRMARGRTEIAGGAAVIRVRDRCWDRGDAEMRRR